MQLILSDNQIRAYGLRRMTTSSGIEAHVGHDVILGIRPSDFEDARLTDESWPRMPVVTHMTEALGSEIHVIFAIDAPPVEHKDLADLVPEKDEEEGSASSLYGGKWLWTARINARSTVRIAESRPRYL
jgi:multiple sugar transport system ATP-binding protein